ncbi:MAG: MarR family winged helix-turn-helix transcriptional regulator [Clostridiales bacterium]|nr:MarR family winged helix-turn-helix transcriptional regulator [Clostridiales bacterium]
MAAIQNNLGEDFFLNRLSVERVFAFIDQTDFLWLYHIERCGAEDGRVYLSDLAAEMDVTVPVASKSIHALMEKGYVLWETDEKRERTYVSLTNRARELMTSQRQRLSDSFEKVVRAIPGEELETTMNTMAKIRAIVGTENKEAE